MKTLYRLGVVLFLTGLLVPTAWGQAVNRGPYLQQQTEQSIIVRWRTDVATDSVVRYGTDSAVLNLSSSDATSTTEHTVLVSGLSSDTQYFYSVGSSSATLAGDVTFHFATAPIPGTAVDTRVWVIGDSGTANNDARAVRDAFKTWSTSKPANFFLMLGDNAYNDGTDTEYQNAVFDTYPELLRQLPVWSTLGNHDGHSADSGTQTGPYYEIFDFPTAAEAGGLASGTEAYYAFDYGNIHFVVLDSYDSNRTPGGNMLQWLESDLALNNKPWLIAIWHHPPYTKGSHNSDTEGRLIDMRQNALPILEAWGVDLVMTGHSHTYERSFLLDGHYGLSGTLDIGDNILDIGDGSETGDGVYQKPDLVAAQNEGAVYAVAGSSGKISTGRPLDHPAMFIALESLGSMVLDIAGNRMDVTFLDQTALVKDEFTILKTPDFDPPLITAVNAEDASHVLVNYSERVDAGSALDAANYAITGLSISSVELLDGNTAVRLTTSVMTAGSHYVLTVNNVMDESGNTIAAGSQAEFDFNPQMTKSFQDGLAPDTSYNGTFDTYIREATAGTNYGAAGTLQVDGDEPSGTGTDMSILLGWDISTIPANATVQSATMYLNTLNISSGPYFCYGLLRSWEQLQATWNDALTASSWATAGALGAADRDSLSLCTISAPSTGPLAVSLNADGIAMVQSWIDGSAPNYGMVIADSVTNDGADFDSSESANAMNRPKLEIVYTVPVVPPNTPPVAAFSESCTNLVCNFSDGSTDSDGTVVSWLWDFGDGNTSASSNPSHTYASAGSYTVQLTVTDDDSDTGVTSHGVIATVPAISSLEVMSWVPVYAIPQSQAAAQADFGACDAVDGLTRIGLQFWTPNSNGTIKYADHEFYTPVDADVTWWKNWAASNGIEVMLTIYNNNGSWDWPLARSAFAANRATFVAALVAEMDRLGLDGIDLDLEGTDISGDLQAGDRADFDLFVHELFLEISARGKLLTINSFSYIWNAPNQDWWGDWLEEVDNIHSMGYENLFEAGPGWQSYSFQQNTGLAAGFQAETVSMGMPAWVASWGTSSGRGTTAQAHVQEVRFDISQPTGIAIWDMQLTAWQDSALWCEIAGLKNSGQPQPPIAPSGLSAGTYSSSHVDLAWVDNAGDELGYKVERSPAAAGSWTEIVALAADTSGYSDMGLAAGSAFDYRVFAYNAAGESSRSATATATTFTIPRVVSFSGRSWTVKSSAGPVGPGPNYFADTSDDVWVDGNGYLHLRIMFRDGVWHSSEVVGDDVLGYGTYTFTLGNRVDLLDRNTVVGLFTWDTSAPEFNYREIDIEFARWDDPLADNSQYVVQPWDTPGNTNRWETALTGNDSTHAFTWQPDRVEFSSHQGSPPAAQIQAWTYAGPDVPPEGTSSGNARINFWLNGGNAPSDGQQAELVIKSFDFTPLPAQSVDYPASGQIAGSGTVSGSFTDTQTDNGVSQSIRERESGGKKQNRYSFMEHKWTFDVAPAAGFVFNLNAWSSGSADGDEFVFSFSTDDSTYTDFLTLGSTDPANVQVEMLPDTLSGTVYIRVRDTDRTAGNKGLDTVYIDHMYIHAENAQGSPPAAPSNPGASTLSASSIALDWTDNATDELGFELQRSTDQVSWDGLPNAGADVTGVTDTGLTSDTTYHYRIRAFNLSGSSDWIAGASATTDTGPPPSNIDLTLTGSKTKGKHVIDLGWTGTTTGDVDIFRDGGLLITMPHDGSYTDNTSNKGGRSYTYQVCEAGTGNCSAVESIVF